MNDWDQQRPDRAVFRVFLILAAGMLALGALVVYGIVR